MNYYNPYFYTLPTSVAAPRIGLLGRLFGNSGVTLGGILNGTQRALNFANQAIPLVKQVKPMIGNAKTMFRVMNEFKRVEVPNKNTTNSNTNNDIQNSVITNNEVETSNIQNTQVMSDDSGPTFFM